MSGIGAAVLAAALVATGVAAWWLRARDGALRSPAGREGGGSVRDVLRRLGAVPGEADLTVVQFSTAFCAPCRTTRARLEQLRGTHPGLAYLHVDAESHLDEVRELDVRRTPTLFYLDRDGELIGRSSGAPDPAQLRALVEARTGARS
jgi:thiol-disulfide isomerase/thioredoxin